MIEFERNTEEAVFSSAKTGGGNSDSNNNVQKKPPQNPTSGSGSGPKLKPTYREIGDKLKKR
ncbi:MAG: hypothetical protein OXF52_03015 [Candidatus Dadabacteria bacterium]|nr:hypothetical protein [Candidatus Dadabacteria bacterium]